MVETTKSFGEHLKDAYNEGYEYLTCGIFANEGSSFDKITSFFKWDPSNRNITRLYKRVGDVLVDPNACNTIVFCRKKHVKAQLLVGYEKRKTWAIDDIRKANEDIKYMKGVLKFKSSAGKIEFDILDMKKSLEIEYTDLILANNEEKKRDAEMSLKEIRKRIEKTENELFSVVNNPDIEDQQEKSKISRKDLLASIDKIFMHREHEIIKELPQLKKNIVEGKERLKKFLDNMEVTSSGINKNHLLEVKKMRKLIYDMNNAIELEGGLKYIRNQRLILDYLKDESHDYLDCLTLAPLREPDEEDEAVMWKNLEFKECYDLFAKHLQGLKRQKTSVSIKGKLSKIRNSAGKLRNMLND